MDTSYIPQAEVDKTTLKDRVYRNLREDILSNRLPPGTPLQEPKLASALGVSRGPVREALQFLAAEGLVDLKPRKGAVVSSLSPDAFLDAYRLRESLEVLAVRLAALNLSRDDLDTLRGLHREMVDAAEQGEIKVFFRANARFHSLIVERSANRFLCDAYFPLFDQMRRYRLRSVSLRGGLNRSCEEHHEILAALERRDGDEAARLVGKHIQVPQRILESAGGPAEFELAVEDEVAESE